jgi:hypothetical protein
LLRLQVSDELRLSTEGGGAQQFVLGNGGNVGIGTATPAYRLHVQSSGPDSAYVMIEATDNELPLLSLWRNSEIDPRMWTMSVAPNGRLYIEDSVPANEVRMQIDTGGRVGINVATPQSQLDVGGDIHTSGDITLEGGITAGGAITATDVCCGADYVFDPDYLLMPLEELAAYVGRERHLPDIPDAAEVAAHGVNVTALQMQLLRWIEELTLHSIAQHRQVEALGEVADAARERSHDLSRRNDDLGRLNGDLTRQYANLDRRLDEETRARRAVEARLAALEGRLGSVR